MKLLLILLLILVTYLLWNYFKKPNTQQLKPGINKKFIDDSMEQIGKNIKNSIVLLDPSILQQKTEELIDNGALNESVENIVLNKQQENYFNYLSDVIIGKYKFSKVEEILTVNNVIKDVIVNIPVVSLDKYYPRENDHLLLIICRKLMETFNIPIMKKLLIGQWIINKTYDNNEITNIYDYISYISTNQDVPLKIRMNAADILNQSNNNKYITDSKKALNIIRKEEDNIDRQRQLHQPTVQDPLDPFRIDLTSIDEQRILLDAYNMKKNKNITDQLNKNTNKSVYNDSQNVHESSINKSVIDAAKKLISEYKPERILTFEYSQYEYNERDKIKESIHRIMTDVTTFNNGFTLYEVYQSLLQKIETSSNKDELYKRLKEELIDMSGLCATGHLSRLLMVSQGFDNNETMVKMDIDKEMYSKIKSYLDKAIQEAENSDDLIESLVGDKKLIKTFIHVEGVKILQEIVKEYKNVEDNEETIKGIYASCLDKYIKS
jgi:hypothetical protein